MFDPKLEILPPVQRALWEELQGTPASFVLYGGTGLSLRLGHRSSIDFDFFSSDSFLPGELHKEISYLRGAERLQSESNTLTCLVERLKHPVKVSLGRPVKETLQGAVGKIRFERMTPMELQSTRLDVEGERL